METIKYKCKNNKCSNTIEYLKWDNIKTLERDFCSRECYKEHVGNIKNEIQNTVWKCEKCGKILSSKANLERHLELNACYKIYKCSRCDQEFDSITAYKYHINNGCEQGYICEFCNKKYRTQNTLTRHLLKSHKDKIKINHYQCEICFKNIDEFQVGNYIKPHRKTCSEQCLSILIAKYSSGYNKLVSLLKGNRNCKWYKYIDNKGNNHKLQGLYELAFAMKLDELNIEFVSHPKGIKYINQKNIPTYYFPDFYIPSKNLYIDTKSRYWLNIQGLDKFKNVRNQSNINLLILTEEYLCSFGIDNVYKYIKKKVNYRRSG